VSRFLPASLRSRLALLALVPIVPALLLSLYTFAEQRHFAVNEGKAQALRLARQAATEQEQLLTGTRDLLIVVARQARASGLATDACGTAMSSFMSPFFINLGVATLRGDVVCSAALLRRSARIADIAYFERALQTRDFVVGAYEEERVTGRLSLPTAYPVLDGRGRVQGVVFAALDPDWLTQLAAKVELPQGAHVTIADARGTIVARYPNPERATGRALPGAVLQALQIGRGEGVLQARGLDGASQLFAVTRVRGINDVGRPHVSVEIPTAVALAATERGFLLNLLGLALIGVLAFVGTWIGGNVLILRPVTGLVAAARRLRSGDLDARTGLSQTAGELGQLARTFDEMAASIEQHITEVQRAEEALERASRQNELILKSAGEGIFGLDVAGHVSFVNPAAATMLGRKIGEVLGQPMHDLVHHSKSDETFYPHEACPIMAALKDGRVHHVDDEVFWRKDNTSFPVEYTSTPIREGGAIVGAVVVIRDSTERRQAEEVRLAKEAAEKASRAKSEFLSRMSHELRTPLNAVLGFAQLLEMDAVTPNQQQSVEQILKAGRHLLDLINEVLDLARIEAGRLGISPEPVAVREVVQECMGLIAPLAAGEHVRLESHAHDGGDYFVVADRQRLKQVLLNFLSNAVKYNRRGGVVRVSVAAPTDGRLRIDVTDTGPGIPSEMMTRLFMPFERLAAAETTVEGTGLGLALSKGLIEAMGGTVGVESVVGEGSTFWLELALAQPPAEAGGDAAARDGQAGRTARTLLYIEDNLSNLKLIESLLARRPEVRLLSVMQGRLGLDLAIEHRPQLILLDLHLPDLPGEEVLLRLRAAPETRQIPVVVISADATGQVDRLLALGAKAYLTKPLDVKRLLDLLDETLGTAPGSAVRDGA